MSRREILANNKDPAIDTGRLDVPAFVKARQAEIQRLENAIATSGASGKKRAFQLVPRRLRRRTASHNAKRVPRRLRERAQYELERDNALAKTHKRPPPELAQEVEGIGGQTHVDLESVGALAQPPKIGLRYGSRQQDKIWLPTHVWHKKRAHVAKMWGYMVPIRPSQKQYRASHRVLRHLGDGGALVWDTSYYATLVLRGRQSNSNLSEIIDSTFPGAGGKLYTKGGRVWQGLISEDKGPALVCWLASDSVAVHVHPLLFEQLWSIFQAEDQLELHDCRYAVGSIDIAGSQALAVLHAALLPYQGASLDASQKSLQTYNELWQSISGIGSADSLPFRSALSLLIHDPRLYFPPQIQKARRANTPVDHVLTRWPSSTPSHLVFDRESRQVSVRCKASQSAIDARRKAGNRLVTPEPTDPCIPASLFVLDDGRVRLLLPREWVLPVWLTVTHVPNVLYGGLEQLRQLSFERGQPHFPNDYLWTKFGQDHSIEATRDLQAQHDRRPPNKRPRFFVENPFVLDPSTLISDRIRSVVVTVDRGVPESNARIYSAERTLIGFVTTGSFNLSAAKGTGVGVATEGLVGECYVQNVRSDRLMPAMMVPASHFPL